MKFSETPLQGAFVIELEKRVDSRGFFARSFCRHEFEALGLNPEIAQANIAFNHRKGTVRGLHFQYPPDGETKVVRCSRGAMLDVIVDLRPESATFLQHFAIELSAENRLSLYIPDRFAHGYQSLEDATETTYLMGSFFAPGTDGGLHYADPRLAIRWPLPVSEVSDKDKACPLLQISEQELRRRMAA